MLPANENITKIQIAREVNKLAAGKLNSTGSFTLTPNSTATTVTDARCGGNSVVLLSPMSETCPISPWIVSVDKASFTVGHGLSTYTDMEYRYVLIG